MKSPRALLVSLRDPTDPMSEQERLCFAERADVPLEAIDLHPMAEGRPDKGRLRSYDAVFFGGSGAYSVLDDVPWIRAGLEACLEVIELRVPAFASCFGFQGLAKALGGEVIRDDARQELGAYELDLTPAGREDEVLGALPSTFWGQEGHHDHVMKLPRGVTLLATGRNIENQAFKVDGAPFWASQFHPELTIRRTVERFRYYSALYSAPGTTEAVVAHLESGTDTPEMADVLKRVVRLGR